MAKRNKRLTFKSLSLWQLALAGGLLLLIVFVGWTLLKPDNNHVEWGADQSIDITPEQIQSIKEIGEWEFLSVSDEEMIDTIRRGIFSDDHLVRIYYGTLRLGVNLKQLEPGWITTKGDTIKVMLPKIELLDRDFIDEARTRSFYESGKWTPQDREKMFQRAYHRMLRRGMTPQNIQSAEQNGNAQVRQVLQGMGFKQVKIQYKD